MFGKEHRELMKNGDLGRAIIQQFEGSTSPSVVPGSTSSGSTGFGDFATFDDALGFDTGTLGGAVRCKLDLMVYLDNTPGFPAQTHAWFPTGTTIVPGQSVVAVRVDPADHTKVAVDLSTAPPQVRLAESMQGSYSVADVLAAGLPCELVIKTWVPYGMTNPAGIDMYTFTFTVVLQNGAPYEGTVVNPLPPESLPLVFPGAKLPAKFDPAHPDHLAIDWAAAQSGGVDSRAIVVTSPICQNCGAAVPAGVTVCQYCHADTRALA